MEKTCETCKKDFNGFGDVCPACKATERSSDLAVGDKGA